MRNDVAKELLQLSNYKMENERLIRKGSILFIM